MHSYTEIQRLRTKWVLAIPLSLTILFIYAVIQQVILGIPFGAKPASNGVLIGLLLLLLALTGFFLSIRLSIKIDAAGIHYRFFPFHRKYASIPWHALSNVYIRDYRALFEYGGWGLKGRGNNNCITVSGGKGLQLVFQTGAKTLLGTRQPEKLTEALRQYCPLWKAM